MSSAPRTSMARALAATMSSGAKMRARRPAAAAYAAIAVPALPDESSITVRAPAARAAVMAVAAPRFLNDPGGGVPSIFSREFFWGTRGGAPPPVVQGLPRNGWSGAGRPGHRADPAPV